MSHHRLFLVTFAVFNDIIHLRNLYIYPAYMKVETFVEESLISLHMSPTLNALIILGFAHPSSSLVSDEFWLICFVHQRHKKTSQALCLSDSTFDVLWIYMSHIVAPVWKGKGQCAYGGQSDSEYAIFHQRQAVHLQNPLGHVIGS